MNDTKLFWGVIAAAMLFGAVAGWVLGWALTWDLRGIPRTSPKLKFIDSAAVSWPDGCRELRVYRNRHTGHELPVFRMMPADLLQKMDGTRILWSAFPGLAHDRYSAGDYWLEHILYRSFPAA